MGVGVVRPVSRKLSKEGSEGSAPVDRRVIMRVEDCAPQGSVKVAGGVCQVRDQLGWMTYRMEKSWCLRAEGAGGVGWGWGGGGCECVVARASGAAWRIGRR